MKKIDVYLNYERGYEKFKFKSKRGLLEFLTENDLSSVETITIQFYEEEKGLDHELQAEHNEGSRSPTNSKRNKEPRPAA